MKEQTLAWLELEQQRKLSSCQLLPVDYSARDMIWGCFRHVDVSTDRDAMNVDADELKVVLSIVVKLG